MPISTRLYVLEPDGALKRIPMRVVNGLVFGADSVPAYAGTSQRIVQVLVDNEDGRPVRLPRQASGLTPPADNAQPYHRLR